MPSDYTFSDKDLEFFAICSEDLLKFSFNSSVGGAHEDQVAKAGTAEGSAAQVRAPDDSAAQDEAAVYEVREVDVARSVAAADE